MMHSRVAFVLLWGQACWRRCSATRTLFTSPPGDRALPCSAAQGFFFFYSRLSLTYTIVRQPGRPHRILLRADSIESSFEQRLCQMKQGLISNLERRVHSIDIYLAL